MATVTINGTVKLVGETQQVSDRFSKREIVVIESSSQYPQHIPIEFAQDKTALLDDYAPGEQVSVTCYVNGREWTSREGVTRHFLSLRGDHIQKVGTAAPQPGGSAPGATPPPPSSADVPPATEEDDLPF